MSVRCYVAHAMTGRSGNELLAESAEVKKVLERHGIEPLDPVITENVKKTHKPLHNNGETLKRYWARDKKMIREAHVLLDITGPAKSEGVAHEIGLARYGLWKPVIRVYEHLGPSIARIEDDYIARNVEDAARMIEANWGTFWKRLVWRLKLLNRCLPRFILWQLQEFK